MGICHATKYCLGYSSLFDPVKPQLTNLLMVLIAMQNPLDAVDAAVMRWKAARPPCQLIKEEPEGCEIVDHKSYKDPAVLSLNASVRAAGNNLEAECRCNYFGVLLPTFCFTTRCRTSFHMNSPRTIWI